MDFKEFQTAVIEEMRERFPELTIKSQQVDKMQGQSYDGISVSPQGSNIAATMNIGRLFESMKQGTSMYDIMDRAEDMIRSGLAHMPSIDAGKLSDYDRMKDSLTLQILPIVGNEERLKEVPHKFVEDMAVVYRMELAQTEEGTSSVLVTNEMLGNYGITPDQLHQDALEAAMENRPATFRSMNDVMRDMMGDLTDEMGVEFPDEPTPLWVASTEGMMNGAAVIQYPGFLDDVAATLGGDFYVLPSSIHEVLCVPDNGAMELQELENMVREVNATEVAPEDRLSDNVYHYDSESRIFENARTFEARVNEKDLVQAGEPFTMTPEELQAALAPDEQAPATIHALLVEPNQHPRVVAVGTELSDLQEAVGGNIETVYPFDDPVALICNEEGKNFGLPLNRALRDEDGEVYDVMAGSFLVVGLTDDNFGSLTSQQIDKYEAVFHQPEAFVKMGKSILAIPIPEEVLQERAAKEEAKAAKSHEEIGKKPKDKKPRAKKPKHDER